MAPKSSSSHGKRSSLSRATSSRRKHGRAVTIEDVLDSEDHLYRISEASTPVMGSSSGEVSAELVASNEGDSLASVEASKSEEAAAAVNNEEEDTAKKPGEETTAEEEEKPIPNSSGEESRISTRDVSGTSTAAETRDPSPAPHVAEQKGDEGVPNPEASKPTGPRVVESGQPHPRPFLSPMGQWAHPNLAGQPPPPQYRPFFPPPPLPPMSPPPFGMPHPPPMLMPEGQMIHHEPPPLSGYELLASRLSCGLGSIPPLYRRFQELHNRVLLSMTDELNQLTEKLHLMDAADHNNRIYRDGVLPASCRVDVTDPNEVNTARNQLMDHIQQKMYQYGKQMECFEKLARFRDAMPSEVHEYKSFLATHAPVVPSEMRFLDQTHDLMCLPGSNYYVDEDDSVSVSGRQTPAARTPRLLEAPMAPSTMSVLGQAREYTAARSNIIKRARPLDVVKLRQMGMGVCLAIFLPILSFPIIADFVSRLTVVALVALGMAAVGAQSGAYDALAGRASAVDAAAGLAVYVGFMVIVAVTFG
ncbi:hypothetical protein PWT90_07941 [Aphanocladium album]|nr:hypothetical protein PWT90_07941 [Aphanocladium album]